MSNFTTWRSLVDGNQIAAIPDSTVEQFDFSDPSSVSTNGDLTAIDSQLSETTLTGTFSDYVEGEINGRNVGLSDGVDDSLDADFDGGTLTTPITTIAVFQVLDAETDLQTVVSSNNNESTARDEDRWLFNGTDFVNYNFNFGTNDVFIQTVNWNIDDTSLDVWMNGTLLDDVDTGSEEINANDFEGIGLAYRRGNDDRHGNYHHCEYMVYDEILDTETRQEEEQRLSDKWDISLA